MPEVPATNTPIRDTDAAALLVSCLRRELGRVPSRNLAAFLLAQLWLESARGTAMNNNNPGNLTANPDTTTSDFWRPPWFAEPTESTSTRNRQLHEAMQHGQAPSAFLAFPTMLAGFETYVSWIHRKFPSIEQAAESGDSLQVAKAIRTSGYCPDCEPTATAKTLGSFRTQFLGKGFFNSLPLAPAGGATRPASSLSASQPPSSGGAFVARKLVDLPSLSVGCMGPAVELLRVLVSASPGNRFDDGLRDQLAEMFGTTFSVDNIVGPRTWQLVFARTRETYAMSGRVVV
jgi:hypothetical protein